MGTIYLITNLVNGKYYVGQTTQPLRKRLDYHFYGPPGCPLLSKAIKKYGKQNFAVNILAESDSLEELNKLEALWVVITNSTCRSAGYNINPGGKNSKQSPETIEKRRQSMMGHVVSDETRRKQSEIAKAQGRRPSRIAVLNSIEKRRGISVHTSWKIGNIPWNKGVPANLESVEKMKNSRLGYRPSEETKAKTSASMKGRMPAVNLRRMDKVAKFLAPS